RCSRCPPRNGERLRDRRIPRVRLAASDSLAVRNPPLTRASLPPVLVLREVAGLPDPNVQPPIVAELGDPFAELRVVHLIARLPLGTKHRVRDLVDELNHQYVDW